jgi:hypothetical protein
MPSMRDSINATTKSRVYLAPEETPGNARSIFLAGSIDMGRAENWQDRVTVSLLKAIPMGLEIYNPRRDDWDSSWEQDISHPQFAEQVRWELAHLESADVICYYFDPKGEAPITLMELGLHASTGKAVVCCPEGYWRRGNVQVVCDRYDIPFVNTIEELTEALIEKLNAF